MDDYLLEGKKINAWYGKAQALFDVDIHVSAGETVSVMGRNGAGKSTLLKAIVGLVDRQAQLLRFHNDSIISLRTPDIIRRGLSYVPEDRRIFTDLTVEENLLIAAQNKPHNLIGSTAYWSFEKIYELFPNIKRSLRRYGNQMSGGEQQMLTIARGLVMNPTCILLDEPSEGVAPVIVEQLLNALLEVKKSGISIIISEQNLSFTSLLADRAYLLDKGSVVFDGPIGELREDMKLIERYLGA